MRVSDIISGFEIYSFLDANHTFQQWSVCTWRNGSHNVFQNNEVAAMLMYQTNPVGVHMNVVPRSTMNTNGETEN